MFWPAREVLKNKTKKKTLRSHASNLSHLKSRVILCKAIQLIFEQSAVRENSNLITELIVMGDWCHNYCCWLLYATCKGGVVHWLHKVHRAEGTSASLHFVMHVSFKVEENRCNNNSLFVFCFFKKRLGNSTFQFQDSSWALQVVPIMKCQWWMPTMHHQVQAGCMPTRELTKHRLFGERLDPNTAPCLGLGHTQT